MKHGSKTATCDIEMQNVIYNHDYLCSVLGARFEAAKQGV